MNKLFTQIIETRNLTEDYIHPKYEDLRDPFELPDMKKAVERIKTALEKQEKILIYGDYDVDGVTASTVMESALKLAGLKDIEIMLPDRFIDGYGMSPRLIERAKEENIDLVITVDCGSRNHAIVEELNLNHIDVIITDHHECEDTLPEAIAVINPHRHDLNGEECLKDLAGVGVAFKLAQALAKEGLIKNSQEKWLLDLVLIGTLCDSMRITKENRILTYYGKIVLEKTRRPGLKEIMKHCEVTMANSEAISFRIGPRLNAAGRLETAEISLNLLRTTSAPIAAQLAKNLENLNDERKKTQKEALEEIKGRLKSVPEIPPVIIETGAYHEGIIGIVAGRLVDNFHRPAFVLAEVEDGTFKGSGRSFGEFNLAEALEYAKDATEGGGGHAAAAGVRVKRENLFAFREKITEYYNSLNLEDQERFLRSSADLEIDTLEGLDMSFMDEVSVLEPFGRENEEPIFCLRNAEILDLRAMGKNKNHLRLTLSCQGSYKFLVCVAFSAPTEWFNLDVSVPHSFIIRPSVDEFKGNRSVEAFLLDVLE